MPPKKKTRAKPKEPSDKLTPKERVFVEAYVANFNATRAAKEAGYSEATARKIGYNLLQRPRVKAAVEKLTEARLAEVGVSRESLLLRLGRIATADIRDVVSWDEEGNVTCIPSDQLTDDQAAAIAEFSQTVTSIPQKNAKPIERKVMKVKMEDVQGAIGQISKLLGIVPDGKTRVELTGKDGGPIESAAQVVFYIPENGRDPTDPAPTGPPD